MNNNINKLLELVKENPNLPIIPMVNYEICDGCVRFKSDAEEDTIAEGIAEYKYGDCTNVDNWKRAEDDLKTLWKKAIIVYIELPD